MPCKVWDEIIYPFPNFNGATVEVWEWIIYFIPHFIMNVITYTCWDWSESALLKGATGRFYPYPFNINFTDWLCWTINSKICGQFAFCSSWLDFIRILRGYFTSIGQCFYSQWSNPVTYGWISHMHVPRMTKWTKQNKAQENKTVHILWNVVHFCLQFLLKS